MTGTSQATAFVTGVAALIMASNRELSFEQVKKQILATADEISSLRSKTKTSGKLNSWAALAIQPALPISGLASVTDNTRTVFNPEVTSGTNPLRDLSQLANSLRTPAQN